MEENEVIKTIKKEIKTIDAISYISGNINGVGTNACSLSKERGSVYGMAIRILDSKDKSKIFAELKNQRSKFVKKEGDWKSIGNYFYPLYWGKDINMGSRLFSHTKTMKSTSTIQLDNDDKSVLKNHAIIYGAMPCTNSSKYEDDLHNRYPDLLKTKKGDRDPDNIISSLIPDEDQEA